MRNQQEVERRMSDSLARWKIRLACEQKLILSGLVYRKSNNSGIVYVESPKGDYTVRLVSEGWSRGTQRGHGIRALAAHIRKLEALSERKDLRQV